MASVTWAAMLPAAVLATTRTPDAAWGPGYPFALVVYAIGSVLCHQRPGRSFHLLGVQLPVCARCTGIYAGAALIALLPAYTRTRETWQRARMPSARAALLVSALPTIATLAYEWTTGHTPGNWTRAISGVPLGACVAWIVFAGMESSGKETGASRRTERLPSPS
jgi:uncharacterized membrane protein